MSEVEEMAIEERPEAPEELEEPEETSATEVSAEEEAAEEELAEHEEIEEPKPEETEEPESEEAAELEIQKAPEPSYFRLRIASAKELANLLKAVAILADEPIITFAEDGLRIRSMDSSRIAMVDLFVGRSVFDEYEVEGGGSKICVVLPDLLRLLRKARKGETAELALDEPTGRARLTLRGSYMRSFTIPRLEFVETVPPELKLALTAKAFLDARELRKAIEEVGLIGDFVRLAVDHGGLTLDAESDISSAKIEFSRTCEAMIDLEVKEPATATYEADYLAKVLKAGTALADVVDVELATNKPLRLAFRLPYEAALIYWLAPRVEEE